MRPSSDRSKLHLHTVITRYFQTSQNFRSHKTMDCLSEDSRAQVIYKLFVIYKYKSLLKSHQNQIDLTLVAVPRRLDIVNSTDINKLSYL